MLTFEQCKEVVEKVWGYKRKDWYHGDHLLPSYVAPNNDDAFAERDMVEYEVNSWEGFGRTVEAMEKMGVTTKELLMATGLHGGNLIKATHLAALEAAFRGEE